jgi:hypothetical protein
MPLSSSFAPVERALQRRRSPAPSAPASASPAPAPPQSAADCTTKALVLLGVHVLLLGIVVGIAAVPIGFGLGSVVEMLTLP